MEKRDGIKVIPEVTRNYKKVLGLLLTVVISVMTIGGLMVQASAADDPILFYSSAKAGPNQGWEESPTKGAAITVWGKNIGTSRGTGTITVAGVTLNQSSDYAEWGATTNPATAKGMQRVTFWLNSSMPEGNTEGIYVTVNGKKSNTLPFKIDNTGVIRFLSLDGRESYNGKYATYQGGVNGPWTNFGLTTSKMTPGDFLYMSVGEWTYIHNSGTKRYEYIGTPWGEAPINGTDDLRITVTSYPGEVAVFKDTSVRNYSDYWTFTNLKWEGTYQGTPYQAGYQSSFCAEYSDHSVGLDVVGVEFTGAIDHAIHAFGDDFKFVANVFNTTPTDTTSYVLYMSAGNVRLIKDNEISGGSMYGIHAYDEDRPSCADVGRVMENWVIEGNWFDSSDKYGLGFRSAMILGGYTASQGYTDVYMRNIAVINNIIFSDGSATIGGIRIFNGGNEENIKIYNNIIYGFPEGIAIDTSSTPFGKDIFVKNNIFANISGSHISRGAQNTISLFVDNNLYESTPKLNGAIDANPVVGDPQFVNPGSDFHLQSTSPAIDVGTSDVSAVVTSDYDSNPRPMDGDNNGTAEYDIGAYEYTGTYTPVLQITTTSLPNGTVGFTYSQTLQATGGTPPYIWSIISGTLPDGLSLNSSNGEISGTPVTEGAYNFTIQVTDSDTNTDTQALSISVSGVSCSYSVSPPTIKLIGSSGGEGSVSVSVLSSCTWTASSGASWITITSGSSGSGNGTVNYSVAANSNTTSRTGTMTIAGKTFTVYQSGSFGNLTMPAPIGQMVFPYDPTATPEASTNPAEAMPIGVGDVATGGDILNIQIGLGQFSAPVDIYGAYMLTTDPDYIYILNPDLTFQVFSVEEIEQAFSDGVFPVGVKPWLEKTVGPIDKLLFNMPTAGLPPGTYYLYLLITPAGSLDSYYLWRTYFEVIGG